MTGRLLALILLAFHLSATTPEDVGLSQERLSRIRPAMERAMADGEAAGAVGLIARHGKIAYFETYGQADREANKPMQKDTISRMYLPSTGQTGEAQDSMLSPIWRP